MSKIFPKYVHVHPEALVHVNEVSELHSQVVVGHFVHLNVAFLKPKKEHTS